MKESIQHHGFEYSRGVLILTLKERYDHKVRLEYIFIDEGIGNKTLKPHVKDSLVDGRHRIAAFLELSALDRPFSRNNHGPCMLLLTMLDRRPMSPKEIVLYVRSCNSLTGLLISDLSFLTTVKTILRF